MPVNGNRPSLNIVSAGSTGSAAGASGTGGAKSFLAISSSSGNGGGAAGSASTGTGASTSLGASTTLNPPPPQGSGAGANEPSSGTGVSSNASVGMNNASSATLTFASLLNDAWMTDPNLNINALVQAVLRNSYQDNQQDLKDYAYKVEFYNNLKKNIRTEIASARNFQSANATSNGNAAFATPYTATPTGSDQYNGTPQVNLDVGSNWGSSGTSPGNGMTTGGQITNSNDLNNYISTMEDYLTSVGDDAQLAQTDLQNMSQNQQQTLETLSNLSKSFNDVSMAIIRNIQG